MPRLGFRRATTEHDKFLLVLTAAVFVVVAGLVSGFLLLPGTEEAAPRRDPTVPTISDSGQAGQLEPRRGSSSTATSRPPAIAPPVVGTETAKVVPAPPAKPQPPPRTRPRTRPEPQRFAVLGRPCERPGAYSLTRRYEPVVCWPDARTDRPTWQRLF